MQKLIKRCQDNNFLLIPRAAHHWKEMLKEASNFVVTLSSTLKNIQVSRRGRDEAMRTVDMSFSAEHRLATCSGCEVNTQANFQWPCYHIVAVNAQLMRENFMEWAGLSEDERLRRMYGGKYFVSQQHAAFAHVQVVLPELNKLKRDDTVSPTPGMFSS